MTAGCGVGVVALAPLWVMALPSSPPTSLGPSPFSLAVSSPWHALSDYAGNWTPHFEGADTILNRSYTDGPGRFICSWRCMPSSSRGVNWSVRPIFSLIGAAGNWYPRDRRETLVENFPLTVRESHIRSEVAPRLVWSWYWLGGHMTSNAYMAKLLQATAYLLGGGATEGAVIAIAADYAYSSEEAVNVLEDFLQHMSFLQATNPDLKMSPLLE